MKSLTAFVVGVIVVLVVATIAVAHPWTVSDIEVTDPSPSEYKIRGIIRSTESYNYAGFMLEVRKDDEYGKTVRKRSSGCSIVCPTVEYSKSITLPQSKYYVSSQHCAFFGSHQMHPNSGFAQTVDPCRGHIVDLNILQLQG